MADWPPSSGATTVGYGPNLATSTVVAVNAPATANTKSSWVELTSGAVLGAQMVIVYARVNSGVQYLFDIGVGGAGSEQVLIPDIHVCKRGTSGIVAAFPVTVPTGARIAARTASATASSQAQLAVYLISGGADRPVGRSLVRAYGANPATSGGVSIDPGGTANTKGSWVEVAASTTESIRGLLLAFGLQGNAAPTTGQFLFDVAVGASGSEQTLIANFAVNTSSGLTVDPSFSPCVPVSVPAGSRLSARSQSAVTDATDRLLDVVVYGVS